MFNVFIISAIMITGGMNPDNRPLSSVEFLDAEGQLLDCSVQFLPAARYEHTQQGNDHTVGLQNLLSHQCNTRP